MRDQVASVDSDSFYHWAQVFTEQVSDLSANRRYALLIYDAYRSHLLLRVLQHLKDRRIIVHALPAKTLGRIQPSDVLLFAAYKSALNKAISTVTEIPSAALLDVYEFARYSNKHATALSCRP